MRTLQIELKRKNSRKIYKKRFLASGDQPEKGLKRCFILRFRQRHQDEKDKGGLEALSGGMGLGKEREKGEAEFLEYGYLAFWAMLMQLGCFMQLCLPNQFFFSQSMEFDEGKR